MKNNKFISMFIIATLTCSLAYADEEININTQPTSLHAATNTEQIDVLISQGANINGRDADGETPLSKALIEQKPKEFIAHLIASGSNIDVNSMNYDGYSLLQMALRYEDDDVFKLLVDNGSYILALNARGANIFEEAIYDNKISIINFLLERGLSPNSPCNPNYHLLHLAVLQRNPELVKLLIDKGAKVDVRANESGRTPLHLAVESNVIEIAEFLIDSGADVNSPDYYRKTPLHLAMNLDDEEMTQLLIDKNANVNQEDIQGNTPLHMAIESGSVEIFELLIKNKADIHHLNYRGQSLLHFVAQNRENAPEMAKILIDNHLDVSAIDLNGSTPLHYAAYNNDKVLRVLLEGGANPNIKNQQGETSLHLAVNSWPTIKAKRMVKMLIEKGAEIDAQDNEGKTALHLTIFMLNAPLAELLVSKGANPHLKFNDEMSPFEIVQKEYKENHLELRALKKLFSN